MTQLKHSLRPRAFAAMVLVAASAGCSLAPVHKVPEAPVSARWAQSPSASQDMRASAATTLAWQDFVTDEGLRRLVEVALLNNRDLRQTMLNVQAARAMYRVQRADRLPGFEVQGSGTRQRVPADMRVAGQPGVQESLQAGVGLAAFELDFFGRVRNLSEASLAEYLATEEAARTAQVSLVGEVVQAYLTRDGALRRLQLISQTLESRQTSMRLVDERRKAGTGAALDYQQALGLTEQAKAELERTQREARQASNALALLLGGSDVPVALPSVPPARDVLVQDLAAGTTSELLQQRPDIRAAEQRLKARNADIGAARAAFFPRISLTGFLGSSSADISKLFDSGSGAWSFTPQLTLPIFDGGRNRANLDLATVRRDMSVAAYEQTILVAFREVADGLAATDTYRREETARRAYAETNVEALRLAEARYRAGVDDHLRYLDAQRTVFASQLEALEVSTQRQIALSTLYKSLGGGWVAQSQADKGASGASAVR